MCIALTLRKRLKLMIKWVRNGLILLATLSLLVVGQDKLFPPTTVGRIPDGVIQHRKATQDEKNYNRKIAKDYAQAGFGWSGREWECLLSLWTSESRFDNYAYPKDKDGKPRSSAYGIAQLLGEKDNRAEYQVLRGLKYISKRYGTPCKAKSFFLKHRYY
jgi:hypothetical protein